MRFALLFLAACTMVRADSLNDLRTTLAQAEGRSPAGATVSFELARQAGEEKEANPGKVAAMVEDGPAGLKITWPRAVMDAAAAEELARSKDRNAAMPTRRAMEALSATDLSDYLSASGQLRRLLENATLVEDKAVDWQGRKSRLLTLKITPPLSEKDRKYIKEISVVGKVWIGEDGWPLAAEQTLDLKGRAMLVITFEQHEKEEFRFARLGDRLVTVYHRKDSDHAGGGEKGTEHLLATLVPHQG